MIFIGPSFLTQHRCWFLTYDAEVPELAGEVLVLMHIEDSILNCEQILITWELIVTVRSYDRGPLSGYKGPCFEMQMSSYTICDAIEQD
ncbi:hypothetical protein GOP47_0008521 [Adiantum capillus-veneris]|uniref:Uncharacterized protein n=1 Tax=Adiantum capillus-veneris TaxID=13818 RepID=A0A9D4UYK4_ADICA|nr:hypothetical protein GOP47_0008521 [Adiantum capillus-veneris]